MQLFLVGNVHDQKAQQRAQHGVRVFEAVRDIGKVFAALRPVAPGEGQGVDQISAAQHRHAK